MLFFFCFLVMICSVSVVLFEFFGLKILMMWFLGRLLIFSVMFRFSDLVEVVLILVMGLFVFSFMIEFLLNWCLICVNVLFKVFCLFVVCLLFMLKSVVFVMLFLCLFYILIVGVIIV